MTRLPVIVGFGGINAAGRASAHHAYRRMVLDSLPEQAQQETLTGLATLMNLARYNADSTYGDSPFVDAAGSHFNVADLVAHYGEAVLNGSLIRRIEPSFFSVDATPWQKSLTLSAKDGESISFIATEKHLPEPLPANWRVTPMDDGKQVRVEIAGSCEVLLPSQRVLPVQAAGMLPSGFDPGALYNSRNHPRGLQMTVYAASDAVYSMGMTWETVLKKVSPDQVAVYAGSAMSQLDYNGSGGMLQARLMGKRVTSKQCALGFCEMPADFVNAYVLGSVGSTGTAAGACATFLYNLRMGVDDIKSGRRRVVMVGTSEAPITPEVIDGYDAMGALASDDELRKIDGTASVNHRRASRPFGENCGFTLAESAQFIVLMDDALALELGANIFGAVGNIFVNADGHKKSISAPGAGNYITMAKALASARALLGDEAVAQRSFVQAHGSSTPQNRVTESHILNEAAKAFGMQQWPVAAMKAFLGHSIGSAAGDQVTASLGVWQYGLIPGVSTIDKPADDVHRSHLRIDNRHLDVGREGMDLAVINAKGFGGNNATATLLAPHVVKKMLQKKHGAAAVASWQKNNESVAASAEQYDREAIRGTSKPIYLFDHQVIDCESIAISKQGVKIPGFSEEIVLPTEIDYPDMV
ncbi:MAG: beta-ketoacyl synthase [Pseudomonadales bacterium]|nr:beta-ketoacyl synthase [Pseudomonadales bacterium]